MKPGERAARLAQRGEHTFGTQIVPSDVFGDAFQPPRLHALEPALPLDKLLATHVHGAIAIPQDNASPPPNKQHTYEEGEEQQEECGEDDEEGEEDEESVGLLRGGDVWGIVVDVGEGG